MKFIQVAVEEILGLYDGKLPLNHFIKSFCKAQPKLGSRDRRAIGDAVYTYFRTASFVENPKDKVWSLIAWALETRLIANPSLQKIVDRLEASSITPNFELKSETFNYSNGISAEEWLKSMLHLPKTFIRLTKKSEESKKTLKSQSIDFETIDSKTVVLANGIQLEKILNDSHYVVQDYSSQRSLDAFKQTSAFEANANFRVWDTCCGAGGKMLLLKDSFPNAQVFCTDIRVSILHNLKMRVQKYGYKNVTTKNISATDAEATKSLNESPFDLVLSDVPCSGSGTWGRTPEQFYFFKKETLSDFSKLQYDVAVNATNTLKPGAYFVYITCSVFREENEEVISKLLSVKPELELLHEGIINGIKDQADSMFTAVLKRKPL